MDRILQILQNHEKIQIKPAAKYYPKSGDGNQGGRKDELDACMIAENCKEHDCAQKVIAQRFQCNHNRKDAFK